MSIYKRGPLAVSFPPAKPGHELGKYTAPHGSYAVCAYCGGQFVPRIRSGANADRYCTTKCHDDFWNERRRAQKQSPPAEGISAEGRETTTQRSPSSIRHQQPVRQHTKLHAVLAELARGRSLNRFEAYRDLHDSVLNSTIPEIEKRGIAVSRREEVVPGFRGSNVRCARYWLEPAEAEKAAVLLGWREASA